MTQTKTDLGDRMLLSKRCVYKEKYYGEIAIQSRSNELKFFLIKSSEKANDFIDSSINIS